MIIILCSQVWLMLHYGRQTTHDTYSRTTLQFEQFPCLPGCGRGVSLILEPKVTLSWASSFNHMVFPFFVEGQTSAWSICPTAVVWIGRTDCFSQAERELSMGPRDVSPHSCCSCCCSICRNCPKAQTILPKILLVTKIFTACKYLCI